MAEVSGRRVRGRPKLGWMDGVMVALRNRIMKVEARKPSFFQCAKDRKDWKALVHYYVTERVSRGHFCMALCSFGPPSRVLVVITWREVGRRYTMRLG